MIKLNIVSKSIEFKNSYLALKNRKTKYIA